MSKIVVGTFMRSDGTPAAGAVATFLLSQDATAPSYGQIGHYPIVVTLDENGQLPSSAASPGPEEDFRLWCNDELEPSGTYYVVSVRDDTYGQIFFERMVIAGLSPINLDNIAPAQR